MHWCHFIVSGPFHISQISVMDTYRFGNLELKQAIKDIIHF